MTKIISSYQIGRLTRPANEEPFLQANQTHSPVTKEKTHTVYCAGLIIIVDENDYTLLLFLCNGFSIPSKLGDNHDQ